MKQNSKTKFGRVHIEMLRAVVGFALSATNLAITSSIAAWLALVNRQRDNLTAIDNLEQIKQQPIKGVAAQKKALKAADVELSYAIFSAVRAYALSINNLDLAAQFELTRSAMEKMSYEDFVQRIQGAIETVTPLVPSLAGWSITPATMTLWTNQTTALANILSGPKNKRAYIKTINENIQEILHQCMYLFHNEMDRAIYNFVTAGQRNYYNEYRNNRKLYPNGHVPTQLRLHLVNDVNEPVNGLAAVEGTDKSGNTVNGYINLSDIPFGYHNVLVTIDGNTRTYGPFRFFKGQSLSLTLNAEQGFVVPEAEEKVLVEK